MTENLQTVSRKRTFLSAEWKMESWESVSPWVEALMNRNPSTVAELENWLRDYSELDAAIYEQRAWKYIRTTCNTRDEEAARALQYYYTDIHPRLTSANFDLLRKLVANPAFEQLDPVRYGVMQKLVRREIEIFREENLPIISEIQTLGMQFDEIAASLEVEINGEKMPVARAARMLEENDRSLREKVWSAISRSRLAVSDRLNEVYSKLVQLRHQVALNAGFTSFTDYCYLYLGRFDYNREDAARFHNAVEKVIRPMYETLMEERRVTLGVEKLSHWDLLVNLEGKPPTPPFDSIRQLIDRSGEALSRIHPEIGELLHRMDAMGHLDLEARIGKAPGGYNYPLPETGVSFIFMNAAGSSGDLTTMVHEMGHAIHAWLSRHKWLFSNLQIPSEVAELASMSMEYLTMDYWNIFYQDANSLHRARFEQLTRPLVLLPWIASIDQFQHWAYDHPAHTAEERKKAWMEIYTRFHGTQVHWPDEDSFGFFWQKQGHIYDVPFYYIEYGIALLGALAVWRNFRRDAPQAVARFLMALEMGYERPLPEIFETAGIRFDMSQDWMNEVMTFLQEEIRREGTASH